MWRRPFFNYLSTHQNKPVIAKVLEYGEWIGSSHNNYRDYIIIIESAPVHKFSRRAPGGNHIVRTNVTRIFSPNLLLGQCRYRSKSSLWMLLKEYSLDSYASEIVDGVGCVCAGDTWIEWKRIWIVCVLCWYVLFSSVCLVDATSSTLQSARCWATATTRHNTTRARHAAASAKIKCNAKLWMRVAICPRTRHIHSTDSCIAWIPFLPEGIPQIWSSPHPSMTFVQKSLRLISNLSGCHRSSSSSSA